MKAIGYTQAHALSAPVGLQDITLPTPVAQGHDLLVEVRAISVNPVDTKVRASAAPTPGQDYKVLGYDASGIVRAVGPEVTLFKEGDRVYYAGAIQRPGTNSELHLVDERIVGHMPASLASSLDPRWVYGLSVLVVSGSLAFFWRDYAELARAWVEEVAGRCRRAGASYVQVLADDDIEDVLVRGWIEQGVLR